MNRLPGKFVWFEHVSNDVARARQFYGALFGWKSDPVPMGDQPYPMIVNGTEAIGGFREALPGMPAHWHSYLSTDDVDAATAAAKGAGANVLMPPTDFGQVGRAATLADPTGAVFSLWKGGEGDRPDREGTPAGDWYWNECMSPDPDKALAFYTRVFGFTDDPMDMGPPVGTYHVLTKNGVARGGLMVCPAPGMPANWLPYVSVADCDAMAAKAVSLGAQIAVPAQDIPDVGRFACLSDPVGAAVAVIKGKFTVA